MFTHVAVHRTKIPAVNKSKIITGTKHIMSVKPTNQSMCPQVRISVNVSVWVGGIIFSRCLGWGLGGTPSMRVRYIKQHEPNFTTLSYPHYA